MSLNRLADVLNQLYPRALGALFLYAAIVKSLGHDSLNAVLTFDGFPQATIAPLGWAVIGVEGFMGLLLIASPPRRMVLSAAMGLLVIYSAQLLFLVFSKNAPSCGCTELLIVVEQRHQEQRSNLAGLIRNCILLLAAGLVWLQIKPRRSRP